MLNWIRKLLKKQPIVKHFCTKEDLRNNCLIAYDGRKLSLHEWAELRDINVSTLYCRLVKSKWTVEKSLTKPVGKRKPRKEKEVPECFSSDGKQDGLQ